MENKNLFAKCIICMGSFSVDTLLQSSCNDFYCRACFKKTLYPGVKTKASGDTRTKIVDSKGKKFMPHPEKYVRSSQLVNLLHGHQNLSFISLSKRPLQCPKADCNKYISVFTLESHFKHEHKEVPIVSIHLDARCASEFYPRDVRYCTTQCIVLLKMINTEILPASRASHMEITEDQKPIMIVMASRIADVHIISDDEEDKHDSQDVVTHNQEDDGVFTTGDRIIVWLASNTQTILSYTVAVSTLDNNIRQKFYGPMLTISEPAEKLCKEGHCLILTHFHCNYMTENVKC
ncbi:hypothetical protein ABEB36_008056 [Hypothenemus hampei]|uniref:DUF4729 domain-containing protein n=1 Tax=Hypothenemus hampei TaxID=57062 RepID=A0ABD1EKJ5_HYPHA